MKQDAPAGFLYSLASGVIAGVALALAYTVPFVFLLVCITAAVTLIVLGALTRFKVLFLAAIFLAAFTMGLVRAESFHATEIKESLLPFVTTNATVEGVVVNDPERRATSLHANIAVTNINGTPVHGELLAILGRNEQVAYGDTVTLSGALQEPQPFETPTGHTFDYKGYLEAQGVSAMMPQASLYKDKRGGFSLQGFLFTIKHYFEGSVERLFPEPDGSLLEGILLGERRGIPQSLTDAFIASSLVHVVVLSGHNITIVSEGVFRALAFLPRTVGYGVGGVLMVLFALMTGAGATTVRALIMALVALFARYLHRSALAMRSLAVAAAAMVLWNPPSLVHDPSFILSVLATFGLITLSPSIEKRLPEFLVRYPNARSIIATTLSVEVFVTPSLLYFSGTFSVFALPANIIALPAVPFAMLAGFVAGVLGLVSPALALVPTFVCDMFLKWLMLVATTVQSLPFAVATVPQFAVWIVLAVYVPLTLFSIGVYMREIKK